MGCFYSKLDEGLDMEYKAIAIKSRELKKLRNIFDKLGSDNVTGLLSIKNILSAWDIEDNAIGRYSFTLYDRISKNKGFLEFKEFVLLTWHVCSISTHAFGFLMMEMYDINRTGSLVTEDVVKCFVALKVPADKIHTYVRLSY